MVNLGRIPAHEIENSLVLLPERVLSRQGLGRMFIINSTVSSTLQEIISASISVRDDPLVGSRSSKDDSISPWAPPCVRIVAAQDGEFVIWSSVREAEAFVVVVLMRIATADRLPVLIVAITLLYGLVDIRLIVAR